MIAPLRTLAYSALAGCLLATTALTSVNAQTDADEGESLLDPAALERLQAMSDFLGAADTLRFRAGGFFDEVEDSGVKIKRFAIYDIVLDRPDHLHFRTQFDDGTTREGWFDGTQLIVAWEGESQYAVVEAAGSVDDLIRTLSDDYNVSVPVADFLFTDIYAQHEEYLLSGIYLGRRTVEDLALDHLSFESIGGDWQVWIGDDPGPVPRRLVIDFVETPEDPQFMATFAQWELDEPVDPSEFAFEPPADWEQIEVPTE